MPGKRAETLLEMMFFIEHYTLNRAWDGLTDDELLWEPVAGCWNVRPIEDRRTPHPFVSGPWEADFDGDLAWAAGEGTAVEPMTTIGWLLWHIGSMPGRTAELEFLGGPHPTVSGWSSPYIATHPVFPTADEAVAALRSGWRAFETALRSASDDQLEQTIQFPGYGGPGPIGTGAQAAASMLNEVSHHATQIGVLRDLYRARA